MRGGNRNVSCFFQDSLASGSSATELEVDAHSVATAETEEDPGSGDGDGAGDRLEIEGLAGLQEDLGEIQGHQDSEECDTCHEEPTGANPDQIMTLPYDLPDLDLQDGQGVPPMCTPPKETPEAEGVEAVSSEDEERNCDKASFFHHSAKLIDSPNIAI